MTSRPNSSLFVVARHAAPFLVLIASMALSSCAIFRIAKDPKRDFNFTVSGAVTTQDGLAVKGADVTLEVDGPVYEAINLIKTRHVLTDEGGRFAFAYISHAQGVKYRITVRKESFETQVLTGEAPPAGHHVIRLKKSMKEITQSQ